ncbi:ADP-ribose pyrophosphatase [uncultured archaeon]|nr:ADP-ribose pyrophosphatase [uncultured archaeon]
MDAADQEVPRVINGVLIYNQEGQIFLAKSPKWKNQFAVPGGHVELGETLEESVKREAKEETGLEIEDIEFLGIDESIFPSDYNKRKHMIFLDFIAKAKTEKVTLNKEFSEFIWVRPAEALNLEIRPSVKRFIELYIQKQEKTKLNS